MDGSWMTRKHASVVYWIGDGDRANNSKVYEMRLVDVDVYSGKPYHMVWKGVNSGQKSQVMVTVLKSENMVDAPRAFSVAGSSLELSPWFYPGPVHQFRLFQTSA